MNRPTLAAVVFAILAPACLLAGEPYEALDAGDVFVATITRVEDKDATNARPPRVWLEVHEVLRGDAKTVRSPALWSPPFHGIDWGDENVPELKLWNVQPLKGPKVGVKLILGGTKLHAASDDKKADQNAPVYHLFAFVRIPYSDAARAKAIATLAGLEASHRKYAEEQAAIAKERELRGRQWRAAMTDAVIDKRTQEADAVAIATVHGGDGYTVETMLKGRPRMSAGGTYYVAVPADGYDKRIADIVWDRPRCILFLSEENLIASVHNVHAKLVDPYEGIVLADDAAIAAVKASLARRPAPEPKPVLVISALPREAAAPLAQAARANFAVVESHQFSGHGEHAIVHVRKTIPHAAFLVTIDSGPPRRVQAFRITPDAGISLYDETWPAKDAAEQIKGLFMRLSEKAK